MKKPLAILLLTAGMILGGCQKEPSSEIAPTPAVLSPTQPAPKTVDYGVYTALLESYDIASRETYDGSRPPLPDEILGGLPQDRVHTDGLNDAQLVDFDGDGVFELVLSYMEFDNLAELWDIQHGQSAPVKVFTLGEEGELHHVDNFSLFLMQDAQYNMELSVELLEVEGKTYVITGAQDDSDYNSTTAAVWEYTLFGFEKVISLEASYGEKLGDWAECTIDGEPVSTDQFDQAYNHWIAPKTSTVVWEGTQQDAALSTQHLGETAEFLSNYPRVQGDFGAAVFGEDDRFVLFEDSPETPVEALARDNYAAFLLEGIPQDGESGLISSYIIRDFSTISAPEYGYETVLLAEDIANYLAENPVENHICVRLDVKPIMDFSVSQYDPQTGYVPYLEWMLFAQEEENFTLEQTFTNRLHQESDKTGGESIMYGITFLGYERVEAITPPYAFIPMEDMEILESYLHQGDEYFLIVPNSETAVIEVYDLDPNDPIGGIGALLHQTSPGVPLILRCNLSDIHQNTAVRIQDGEEYATFNPYVDLMSGMAYVGERGYEMDTDKLEGSPQYTEDEVLEGIVEVVGEDYLLGRVFLRQADEVIFDQTCAVYALGTDTPEKFTAEEFLAIDNDGTVYWYDVLSANWLGWSVQN